MYNWFALAIGAHAVTEAARLKFAMTLVADGKIQPYNGQNYTLERTSINAVFRTWSESIWTGLNIHGLLQDDDCEDLPIDMREKVSLYASWASEICRNRIFFITEDGRYGLGSLNVKPGQEIYYLRGLKTPFVVQKGLEPGKYFLRGDSYVDGLMDNEVEYSDADEYHHLLTDRSQK